MPATRKAWRSAAIAVVVSAIGATSLYAPLTASASSASGCNTRSGTGNHSAWVMIIEGCGYAAVRHRYDPVWSSNNYWTNWSGGSALGQPYYTTYHPTLLYRSVRTY